MQYFKQCKHDCKLYLTYQHFEKDDIGFIICENKKLVQFTDFHLVYNSNGFFFNILLQKNHFVIKNYFSKNNVQFSYIHECQIKGFFYNIESLHIYI